MLRSFIVIICLLTSVVLASGQTPGIDPRGVAAQSPLVIIGVVLSPMEKVIRPDKLIYTPANPKRGPDGMILELPMLSRDYLVAYIYQIRVQEVLKGNDDHVKEDRVISIVAPVMLEGGVALTAGEQYLLALAPFQPKKEDFEKTTVSDLFQPVTDPGKPFDLDERYFQVNAERNGAMSVTVEHQQLIEEIKASLRDSRFLPPRN
jgi:hypothetical protein